MPGLTAENLLKRYGDILEIGCLVSCCNNRDYLIKTCLDHTRRRLGKRARYILMEGDELKLHSSAGGYESLNGKVPPDQQSILRSIIQEGIPSRLTDPQGVHGLSSGLAGGVKVTAIIPFQYVDLVTQQEIRAGALIVESGQDGVPISEDDFEYLKVIGELIGAAVGKAAMTEQLVESYRKKEALVKQTSDAFRNRIAAIGILGQRIARLAKDPALADCAEVLQREITSLEGHLEEFEKSMEA